MTNRTQRLRWCVIAVLAAFSVLNLPAQQGKLDEQKRIQLESAVARFMAAGSIPGISVAVVEKGEYVWSEGFGMADLENFVPATPQTLYRLASISKSLTATAAMELWERGKLGPGHAGTEILPRLSAKTLAHHNPAGTRASGRNSPLQIGLAGRSRNRQYQALR